MPSSPSAAKNIELSKHFRLDRVFLSVMCGPLFWLKNNDGLVDVPTDKGLGVALICRKDYDVRICEQLCAAFATVPESDVSDGFSPAVRGIEEISGLPTR